MVREIEVDDDAQAVGPEIGTLRRVEQVAAATVAGAAGGGVPDGQEEAATVLVQPPQRESPANRGGNRDPAGLLPAIRAARLSPTQALWSV